MPFADNYLLQQKTDNNMIPSYTLTVPAKHVLTGSGNASFLEKSK